MATAPIFRISVDQYHEMIKRGILTKDDSVELLEEVLVEKTPKEPPHSVATGLLLDALVRLVPPGWFVSKEDPVTTDTSEPEPDVMVIRGSRRDYVESHPGPHDAALVIEVSSSSLSRDQALKKRIYARAGVPVYGILNLIDRRLEVYSEPTGPAQQPDYRQRRDFGPADTFPLMIDGQERGRVPVADLLP